MECFNQNPLIELSCYNPLSAVSVLSVNACLLYTSRSQDAKIDEAFCLAELDRAARMGITLFQLDDGWQSGKSPNSKTAGGSFRDIWTNTGYWTPNPTKFPHGLKPIVELSLIHI